MLVYSFFSETLYNTNYLYASFSVDGNSIAMTEDHRVVSTTERERIAKLGPPLKDGESRICGMLPLPVMLT
jgi:hypothetical protein